MLVIWDAQGIQCVVVVALVRFVRGHGETPAKRWPVLLPDRNKLSSHFKLQHLTGPCQAANNNAWEWSPSGVRARRRRHWPRKRKYGVLRSRCSNTEYTNNQTRGSGVLGIRSMYEGGIVGDSYSVPHGLVVRKSSVCKSIGCTST